MAIIKEPNYELEVQPDEVNPNEQLKQLCSYKGVTRWVLAIKMYCKTCEDQKCFDNSCHAGNIFAPHLYTDECEVEQTVLLGEETTEEEAREEIPDWQIEHK